MSYLARVRPRWLQPTGSNWKAFHQNLSAAGTDCRSAAEATRQRGLIEASSVQSFSMLARQYLHPWQGALS